MPVQCLSVHAGYRCRRSGECCSGVFTIPAEPHVVELVSRIGIGGAVDPAKLFVRKGETPETVFLSSLPDGTCVFLETAGDGRWCAIHRRGGLAALPSACRHFPRVFLHDARGAFLSLSHFCPTAASLLLDDGPLGIVDAEPPLAIGEPVDAFDAIGALPPLLRPGLLTDLEGYGAWEREAIRMFARDDLTHIQALDAIAGATEAVRRWKPNGRPLAACVAEAFCDVDEHPGMSDHLGDEARLGLVDLGAAALAETAAGLTQAGWAIRRPRPFDDVWERHVAAAWGRFDRPIARYLAAKLFGHRIAYECRGLRSIVEWLRVSLAVVRNEAARASAAAGVTLDRDLFVEAIRAADLILVHRLDTSALARSLEPIERRP